MEYEKIMCFHDRVGPGNYDTIYDQDKYDYWDEAVAAGDAAILDIVKDEEGIKYIRIHTLREPDKFEYVRLDIQNFVPSLGLDAMDDIKAVEKAIEMITENKEE